MFNLTPVVKNLLLINVAVFGASYLLGLYGEVIQLFALYSINSDNFRAWQFVTYMFLHADLWHLFGNMIGLIIFGTWLEEVWGSQRFLQYYLITGLGAAVLFMGVELVEMRGMRQDVEAFMLEPDPNSFELVVTEHFESLYARNYSNINPLIRAYGDAPDDGELERAAKIKVEQLYMATVNIPMLGASGAVFGVLLAAGLLFPYRRIMLLFPPIPMRARVLIFFYGAYEIYALFQRTPNDQIAHMAHVGGMLVGFILLSMWGEARNRYQ
ncbi:rhomboid family intramembrane serine protease [Cesiribacter sp. SM1]|uniref:rhomboid family intramembrane serine protease n=1 Tax=Cesiribacter sp. SM1 TaxID=2861196 RepID=UPI001CD4023F|nr:rhomboid family intramembrane serine protease [Cesiribacter sp. SM1]